MPVSPTREGFRAAFRRPAFSIAEVAWRWVVGSTGTAVFFYGLFEYLNTLPVTGGDLLFLRTRHPFFVSRAILHILRGSLSRGVNALILATLLLALLWIVLASLGRVATVRAMLEYFRIRHASVTGASDANVPDRESGAALPSLLRLNFLRATVALAVLLGFVGAALLAGFVSSDAQPRPGLVLVLFTPIAAIVIFVGWALNWLLSLAAVRAVLDDEDAVGAIASAVRLCRERSGAVFAVSTWTGLGHLVAFVSATTVATTAIGFAPILPGRLILAIVILVTLLYFAVVDWLYTARLAGYVCITALPESAFAPPPEAPPIPSRPPSLATSIDRDELILSDVPSPAIG